MLIARCFRDLSHHSSLLSIALGRTLTMHSVLPPGLIYVNPCLSAKSSACIGRPLGDNVDYVFVYIYIERDRDRQTESIGSNIIRYIVR